MRWVPDFFGDVTRDHMIEGTYACAQATVINRIMGVVQSHHVGLVRAGVRIKIMERTDLRATWSIEDERCVLLEQRVVATIPAEAVQLEVESNHNGTVFTVKIHGEGWTLKAYGPVLGARQPSKVWDAVNVVVDPQSVDLSVVKS
jgi:hypothetical protein